MEFRGSKVRRALVKIVKKNMDAFAAFANDMGRTSVITHTIKTVNAKPFRHKLRPISFANKQYLKQDIKKLLLIETIAYEN